MNSGSSAFISTGRCSALAFAIRSLHHRSRPSCQSILPPVRFRTTTCSMLFTFGFSARHRRFLQRDGATGAQPFVSGDHRA